MYIGKYIHITLVYKQQNSWKPFEGENFHELVTFRAKTFLVSCVKTVYIYTLLLYGQNNLRKNPSRMVATP